MSCALLRWRCQSSPLSLFPLFLPFPVAYRLVCCSEKNPISFYECQRAREGESERASSVTRHKERERARESERGSTSCANFRYVCVLERAQTRERQVTGLSSSLLLGAHERDLFLPMWAHVCVPLSVRVCVCESVQCTVYSWYWLWSMWHSKRGAAVQQKSW